MKNIFAELSLYNRVFRKLSTCVTFKKHFGEEKYLSLHLSRRKRSMLAQLRFGILPLRLETGRYKGEKVEERICLLCNENKVEDEIHFIFKCPLYKNESGELYGKIVRKYPTFKSIIYKNK